MYSSWLFNKNRIEFTFLHAGAAFDALFLVNQVGLLTFACNGVDRTIPGTECTTDAVFRVDDVLHQGFATTGTAFFIADMFQVFMVKIGHG
jgi:hypothetical protein